MPGSSGVFGRPLQIPRKRCAHFVELEQTKVLAYSVPKVKIYFSFKFIVETGK